MQLLRWDRYSHRSRDDALLQQYGLKANDAILSEEKHMSLYDELINNRNALLLPGGAAQNTARGVQVREMPSTRASIAATNIWCHFQYILPPDSVVFFGCVGKDEHAETLLRINKEAGLQVRYRYDEEQPTGRCGVIITGHNRSMATDLAAANHYTLDHMKENWETVQNAKAYFVGGFHLTVCVPAIMALAEEAAKEDKVRTKRSEINSY